VLVIKFEHEHFRAFTNQAPRGIKSGGLTPFALAMPEKYQVQGDAVSSYKNFNVHEKARFARWANALAPSWFSRALGDNYNESDFARTRAVDRSAIEGIERNVRGACSDPALLRSVD
jgi:hypothetical protein